jgi:hypothetical protein
MAKALDLYGEWSKIDASIPAHDAHLGALSAEVGMKIMGVNVGTERLETAQRALDHLIDEVKGFVRIIFKEPQLPRLQVTPTEESSEPVFVNRTEPSSVPA